jgi:hypothetical protein
MSRPPTAAIAALLLIRPTPGDAQHDQIRAKLLGRPTWTFEHAHPTKTGRVGRAASNQHALLSAAEMCREACPLEVGAKPRHLTNLIRASLTVSTLQKRSAPLNRSQRNTELSEVDNAAR